MIQGEPAPKSVTVHVAMPELTGCAEHPAITTPDCLNSTDPVAATEPTVAVKVTDCPTVEGSNEDDTTVLVAFLLTV